VTPLSVVIVSWETRDLTLNCVDCVRRALDPRSGPTLEAEVCVVDNGSRDGTAAAVRERFPEVRCLELPGNRGYAAGANAGLAATAGRIALLLNTDAEITRQAIDAALALFEREARAAAVGVQLVREDGSPQGSVHAFPGPWRELVPRWLGERVCPRRFPSPRNRPLRPQPVEAVLGAALFVRREALEEVGGLDDGYFFFLEETDWCWRLRDAGWQVWFVPGAPVRHLSGASSKRVLPARTRIEFHRSLYRFVLRSRGRAARAGMIAVRVARTLGTALLLAPAAPFSRRQRARLAERWALLAWHARGMPETGGLREVAGGARPR